MRRLLITAALLWTMTRVGIPMLESWDMGSSVNSIGHSQSERSR